MLQVATQKNNLGEGYCFKSVNSGVISKDELISEMKDFNSTFTEVDAQAAMTISGNLFKKHLAKGEKIVFPFGSFRVVATGTCENKDGGFTLGLGDNNINIVFEVNQEYLSAIKGSLQYKIVPYLPVSDVKITEISVSDGDGGSTDELVVKSRMPVVLKGLYMLFDAKDSEQGVFLMNGTDTLRVTGYFQKAKETIVFFVPDGLDSGEYEVKIVTKPRKDTYTKAFAPKKIRVTA